MSCSEQPNHSSVGLVEGKDFPEGTVVVVRRNFSELQHLAHHQQHHQAAIGIYRQIANRGTDGRTVVVGLFLRLLVLSPLPAVPRASYAPHFMPAPDRKYFVDTIKGALDYEL